MFDFLPQWDIAHKSTSFARSLGHDFHVLLIIIIPVFVKTMGPF